LDIIRILNGLHIFVVERTMLPRRLKRRAVERHVKKGPERKKIKRYIWGLPDRVKANVTSSKPANLHEAINVACELVEQLIQTKATRIGESNKRKWEDHQNNNNNNNRHINTYHHQHYGRQEVVRVMWPPLMEGVMLETYCCVINASCITSANTQLSAGNAKH
nr:hypothetical protein [Tanacetum cinerariifolium]